MIGCHCPVCLSKNPKDKRLRCSALLTIGGRRILIDTSPDFRQQALTHQIEAIDAIIWTHAHQDHVGGMDDLRPLFMKEKRLFLATCLLQRFKISNFDLDTLSIQTLIPPL